MFSVWLLFTYFREETSHKNLFIIQITAYEYFVFTHINKFIDVITQKCEIYFNKLPGNNANPTKTRQVRRLQNGDVKLAKMQLTE